MKSRKLLSFLALPLLISALGGCKSKEQQSEPESESEDPGPGMVEPYPSDANLPTTISYLDELGVQIHYQRTKPGYADWGLWLWSEGRDGSEYEFNYQDDYGTIAYFPLSLFGNPHSLGFIVKKLFKAAGDGNWVKDYDSDRFIDFDMLQADEHDIYHVYLVSGKGSVYTIPDKSQTMCGVNLCQFDNSKNIKIEANNPLKDVKLYIDDVEASADDYTVSVVGTSGKNQKITLNESADIGKSYSVRIEFESGPVVTKNVSIRKLYNSAFDASYTYNGDLGAIYSASSTEFKVWSPVSSVIKLRIYNSGTPSSISGNEVDDQFEEYTMEKGEKGVFSYTVSGDLDGKYYTYVVYNAYNKLGREIVDPYAKACGVNGLRGMVIDFNNSQAKPTSWDDVTFSSTDRKHLTVYETHVADVTSSKTWTGTEANRKKFPGMHESGTTYSENGKTITTGFDHIKELGVNAVEILPMFDQANDETNPQFNWGYNPLNYNCVEGVYSTDPRDGYKRIYELRQLIKAYKAEGIAIIMDVVYNHVNGLSGSNFDVLMPYYYFRYNDSTGSASSGSGCGNDTASERPMYRKFMIDSTKFWTETYKLDGFRFDLMGLHDVPTMNQVVSAVKQINPNITVFGEAWIMSTAAQSGTVLANQSNTQQFVGYGQFNDKGRDALLSGGLSPKYTKGWMNSETNPVSTSDLVEMMKGMTHNVTNSPDKSTTYATCHDNYTLHDRGIAAGIYDEEKLEGANVIANSTVMMSQGTSFMLAGEEMLRTKIVYDTEGNPVVDESVTSETVYQVSENSYASSYKTNELNYSWKVNHPELMETYKKLIALKQNIPDLGLNESQVASSETFSVTTDRHDTVIKVTFNDESYSYTAYIGAASLYKYAKDSTDPFEIDIQGKQIYLDSQSQEAVNNKLTLHAYETIVIREAL